MKNATKKICGVCTSTRKYRILALVGVVVFAGTVFTKVASAQVSLESLPDNKAYNDFVVGPGKTELELEPGQSATLNLTVSNRLGTDKVFNLGVQDFTGSDDPQKTVVLLGDDRGPYSLRDYIHVASSSILIPQGKKARIAVTVTIPADAQPGGLYGSVVVGALTSQAAASVDSGTVPQNPVITRIGSLFFVTVKGPVKTEGHLAGFSLSSGHEVLFDSREIAFNLLFKNDGNVHLDPSGTVTINNMLESTVGNIDVDPWFAMPQSLRFRQISWAPPFLFGRYVAHASIKRGYGSTTDEMDVAFWVLPWKVILVVLIGLIVLIALIRFVLTRFTIVSKSR